MTTHVPANCANSVMAAWPGGSSSKVILLNTNAYPGSSVLQNQTWEFVGGTPDWSNISPASVIDPAGPLPPRSGGAMSTFDGTNVLLFGGNTQSAKGLLGDSWEFSAGVWSVQSPAVSPSARFDAGMAYVSGTGAVLFGGATTAETPLNDTWIFTGGNWSQLSLANGASPAARFGHAMASTGSTIVMFGGSLGGNQLGFDTWSFASSTWTQLAPAVGTSPEARTGAAMVYDGYAGLFVMFGGVNSAGVLLDETWTFNTAGAVWTQVSVANGAGPSARVGAQMVFDAVSDRTVLFGGVSATTMEADNQTWSFNSVSDVWTQL